MNAYFGSLQTASATTTPAANAEVLQEGSKAPEFVLPDADMDTFVLHEELRKHNIVLYFYPKDGTPACTRQAIDFTDHEDEFLRNETIIVGVSPDDCLTHADFRDANGISIRLLSDPDGDVCRLYGVWRPAATDGIKRLCVTRSTFIIGKDGVIRHILHEENPREHVAHVLEFIRKLARSKNGNRQEYGRHP